ncbi:hypothetical protein GCM10009747_37550 [Agromyces humatus]|uniref:Secreted protein n=1 Tax=Agromyces humatus TaxID=279573 RepID=A0ABP4X7E2_9MICO
MFFLAASMPARNDVVVLIQHLRPVVLLILPDYVRKQRLRLHLMVLLDAKKTSARVAVSPARCVGPLHTIETTSDAGGRAFVGVSVLLIYS